MGLKLSKKKSSSKRSNADQNNNSMENKPQNKLTTAISSEPVLTIEKLNDNYGICSYSNGCISLLDFNKPSIIFSIKSAHNKEVTRLKNIPKSNLVCSVSRDKSIALWSYLNQGGVVNELHKEIVKDNAHDLVITGLDVSLDETSLVSGSRDNSVKLWDIATMQMTSQCRLSRNLVNCVQYSHDNKMIGVTGEDKVVRLLDGKSLDVMKEFPKKNYIQTHCEFSEDDRYLLSCSNGFNGNGCEITLWDVRTSRILTELYGHQGTVTCAQFIRGNWCDNTGNSTGAQVIMSCSYDSCVTLWSANKATSDMSDISVSNTHYVLSGGQLNCLLQLTQARLAVATNNAGIVLLKRHPSKGLYHIGSI